MSKKYRNVRQHTKLIFSELKNTKMWRYHCLLLLKEHYTSLTFFLYFSCQMSYSVVWKFSAADVIKMISANHSSKSRAIMAKLNLSIKPDSMVLFWMKVRRSHRDLSIFELKRQNASVENSITHVLSIPTRFHINFFLECLGI